MKWTGGFGFWEFGRMVARPAARWLLLRMKPEGSVFYEYLSTYIRSSGLAFSVVIRLWRDFC
jgi:hypothetical protein